MPWLTQDIADNLLGNARPKSYAACREDAWWNAAFMRWWNEGAANKTMYHAVLSCYEDLAGWYAGTVSDDELLYNWVEQPPDVALIDAGARRGLVDARDAGTDLRPAVDRLWYAVEPQMEMVYGVFYDDVGRAKEAIRRAGVEDAIEQCFPGI